MSVPASAGAPVKAEECAPASDPSQEAPARKLGFCRVCTGERTQRMKPVMVYESEDGLTVRDMHMDVPITQLILVEAVRPCLANTSSFLGSREG